MEFRTHSISWNITRRCNLNCAHCYFDADFRTGRQTNELTTEECFQTIDQITAVNSHGLLILTGGEPLLRKDIYDIAWYAASRGIFVVVGTNGTILSDNIVERLIAAGVKGASISVYSAQPEAHDRFTCVSGSWQAAIRGAKALKRGGLDFMIHTSVMTWNRTDIPEIIDLASRLEAKVANVYFLVCTGRGQGLTDLPAAEYEKMLSQLYQLQGRYQAKMLIGAKCAPQYKRIVYEENPTSPMLHTYRGGCPAATYYCQITPTGDVAPCPYMPIPVGNLHKKSFSEIWQGAPVMQQLRDRTLLQGRCGSCEFQELCGGCRARAYARTGNYLAEDPSCHYEPGKYGGKRVAPKKESTFGLEPEFRSPWTEEARKRLEKIPSFTRGMVIRSVERFAEERGFPTITPEVMKEAREKLAGTFAAPLPSFTAISDTAGVSQPNEDITWTEEALRRVERAPDFVRPGIYKLMAKRAKERGHKVITSAFLTEIRNESMLRVSKTIKKFGFEELSMEAFAVAKKKMRRNARKLEAIRRIEDFLSKRTTMNKEVLEKFKKYLEIVPRVGIPWTEDALEALEKLPHFVRDSMKKRLEQEAKRQKQTVISLHFLRQLLKEFLPDRPAAVNAMGLTESSEAGQLGLTLPWDLEPLERIQRIPIPFIRRQVISRVEGYVRSKSAKQVTVELFDEAKAFDSAH